MNEFHFTAGFFGVFLGGWWDLESFFQNEIIIYLKLELPLGSLRRVFIERKGYNLFFL